MRAQAQTWSYWTNAADPNTITIVIYEGPTAYVVIPDEVSNLVVTAVGNGALPVFAFASPERLVIPDTVTDIGIQAFENCGRLTNATIPGSVLDVGSFAFYDCTNLPDIVIPEGTLVLGWYAFQDCVRLSKATISGSVTSLVEHVFDGCPALSTWFHKYTNV